MKKFFWLFLFPSVALAHPSPDLVNLVQSSLHPGIHIVDGGTRQDNCQPSVVKISGTDPFTKKARNVQFAVYGPSESTTARDVLILPPTGGENFIDRAYAGTLCGQGMRATIIESWDMDTQRDMDLGTYDRAAIRTLAATEHVLEYLRPKQPVSILGTSLGALGASFVLGYDERIQTGVLIVGGDHLADIIAHSAEENVASVRVAQMKAGGFKTIEQFQAALETAVHVNPGSFIDFSGAKKVKMYIALQDDYVPTNDQWGLARAWGKPTVITTNSDHKGTILSTFLTDQSGVVSFLVGRQVRAIEQNPSETVLQLNAEHSWLLQ